MACKFTRYPPQFLFASDDITDRLRRTTPYWHIARETNDSSWHSPGAGSRPCDHTLEGHLRDEVMLIEWLSRRPIAPITSGGVGKLVEGVAAGAAPAGGAGSCTGALYCCGVGSCAAARPTNASSTTEPSTTRDARAELVEILRRPAI